MREKPDENPYSYKDANKRPHQLFLGGDQIYADDVGRCHMHMLIDLSKRLIGDHRSPEALENVGEAREHLPVGSIRKKQSSRARRRSSTTTTPSIKRGAPGTTAKRLPAAGRSPVVPGGAALPAIDRRCADDFDRRHEPPVRVRRVRGDVSLRVEQRGLDAASRSASSRSSSTCRRPRT